MYCILMHLSLAITLWNSDEVLYKLPDTEDVCALIAVT